VYAATLEGSMTTPSAATVSDAADRLHDLLVMLGVDPDERPEHDGPTTAETLARAALSVVTTPVGPPPDGAGQIAAMLRETGAVDVHDDTMPLFDPAKQHDPLDVLSGVDKWVPVDVIARHIDNGVRQWWASAPR
jgi:hypothetical protein